MTDTIPVLLVTAPGDSLGQWKNQHRQVSDPAGIVAKLLDVDPLWETVRRVLLSPPS